MDSFDLIVGVHSISKALKNSDREIFQVFYTEEGRKDLLKRSNLKEEDLKKHKCEQLDSHKLQEKAKDYYKSLKLDFQRVPSGVFILTSEIETFDNNWLYDEVACRDDLKILCLDQITDVHNGAAILRTASFYGVDIVIIPGKKSFGFTPSFYRIASGATESLRIVQTSNLSKVISTLSSRGITCIGLTEHVDSPLTAEVLREARLGLCLVLGKEETGISYAVLRNIKHQLALIPAGDTRSLNVSVAAAISMEKCFSVNS